MSILLPGTFLHDKAKSVIPEQRGLIPGQVYVAIWKFDVDHAAPLRQADLLWTKSQQTQRIEGSCAAYRTLYPTENFSFQHDGQTIDETTTVGELNWRNDPLVVLNPIPTSHIVVGISTSSSRLFRPATDKPVIPQLLKSEPQDKDSHMSELTAAPGSLAHPPFSEPHHEKPQQVAAYSTTSKTSPRLNVSRESNLTPLEQLEVRVQKGVSVLHKLELTLEPQRFSSVDAVQWLQSISNVHQQTAKTKTIIGLLGITGSGKSSIINALLDEERLVPTNCMRACTAVICELSYNHQDVPYRAEIEFIGVDDWYQELKILFEDLLDRDGKVSREIADKNSEAGVAYTKLQSVYPKLTKHEMPTSSPELLLQHANVKCLGSVREIENDDPVLFYEMLQRFVDSKEKAGTQSIVRRGRRPNSLEMEYWPLIKVVRIYTKAAALSTGAVLVDLPGVHDSNQARVAVTESYLKQCTSFWIVAPITRAVDDKCAKDLLGDAFKRQLKMDGGYSSVTFICSKTDDISLVEATATLGLADEFGDLWLQIDDYETAIEKLEIGRQEAMERQQELQLSIEQADEDHDVWEKLKFDLENGKTTYAPLIKSAKRKRAPTTPFSKKQSRLDYPPYKFFEFESDDEEVDCGTTNCRSTDNDEHQDPLGSDVIASKIAESRTAKASGKQEQLELKEEIMETENQIRSLQKKANTVKQTVAENCISGRNNYSRDAIRQDFAAGLKELDQEAAEEENPDHFDPEEDSRDYEAVGESLSVYCVSSRAYQKLKGRSKKDPPVTGFKHVVETEIPQLRLHCISLTEAERQHTSRRFLNSLSQFLNSLRVSCSSEETDRDLSDAQFKQESRWLEDELQRFDKLIEDHVKQFCERLSGELENCIHVCFKTAAELASSKARETAQRWGEKVDLDDRAAGGLYWATYKAVCRRNGVYDDINFNEGLSEPVLKQVATGWEKAFQRRIPAIMKELPTVIHGIVSEIHQNVKTHCVGSGASEKSFTLLEQSISGYSAIFKDTAATISTTMNKRQRNINREFTPVIKHHVERACARCVAESGPGSFKRMKALMAEHVETERARMFDHSIDKVKTLLARMVEDVEDMLLAKAAEAFKSLKSDYTRVVVKTQQSTAEVRREVMLILDESDF